MKMIDLMAGWSLCIFVCLYICAFLYVCIINHWDGLRRKWHNSRDNMLFVLGVVGVVGGRGSRCC